MTVKSFLAKKMHKASMGPRKTILNKNAHSGMTNSHSGIETAQSGIRKRRSCGFFTFELKGAVFCHFFRLTSSRYFIIRLKLCIFLKSFTLLPFL